MNIIYRVIKYAVSKLQIPDLAVRMFKASNDISEIDNKSLPTELIPLNAIQLSRGLLNFTVFQSINNWILPYWAVKQYDPTSISFIPRSHSGVSINVTNRNWTATGNMECHTEPVVDPAGLITPFRNGWSIDFWLQVDDEVFYPSYSENIRQRLLNDMPVVENSYSFKGSEFFQTVYSKGSILQTEINITKTSQSKRSRLILSIRPYNPEGIALTESITYIPDDNCFHVDNNKIVLNKDPEFVFCSDYKNGDAGKRLIGRDISNNFSIHCNKGLASAIAVFELKDENNVFYFRVPLSEETEKALPEKNAVLFRGGNDDPGFSKEDVLDYWESLLKKGTRFRIPDKELTSVIRTSVSTLLMLIDKKSITPGPFTYHQFWFRDAAFMISALDNFNFTNYTKAIIKSFPDYQDKTGYFRSQLGEWDSNGQVLWMVYKHYLLTRDTGLLNQLFPSMMLGIKWIDKNRVRTVDAKNNNTYGLLPKGLSAEHLGLADFYFWDNFWSLAGINCFIEICKILNYKLEENYARELSVSYLEDILSAVNNTQKGNNAEYIPAAVGREADYGMIGSIIPFYPLQLKEFQTNSTLDYIFNNFLINGLFYQNFIHSGLNPYLTFQLAHSYLLIGDRNKFQKLLVDTIKRRSPVNNFPEAIHPLTGGGCMGDGHHGWAAAEIVSAFRDSFLWEDESSKQFRLFAGIPVEWFDSDFKMTNIPTSAGNIDLKYKRTGEKITIKIKSDLKNYTSFKGKIILPFKITVHGKDKETSINRFGGSEISLLINTRKTVIEAEIIKVFTHSVKPEIV